MSISIANISHPPHDIGCFSYAFSYHNQSYTIAFYLKINKKIPIHLMPEETSASQKLGKVS